MDLSEIAIAFKNCNSETNKKSFKDYKEDLKAKSIDLTNGIIVNDVNNYILYDCERLLTKSILNIISSDLLLTKGLFNWAFVTSYYSSFYTIQALNRFQLNFTAFDVKCESVNFALKEVKLTKHSKSSGSHEEQFQLFFSNNAEEYRKYNVDRNWNIGLSSLDNLGRYGSEHHLRNAINYYLSASDDFYYELSLSTSDFNKIIKDNLKSPFKKENDSLAVPPNFARKAFKLAIARIRVHSYILNYIANYNKEYKSYYQRNMKNRIDPIKDRYPFISNWLLSDLENWLQYTDLVKEEVMFML